MTNVRSDSNFQIFLELANKIILPHMETLSRKKSRLISLDDYGKRTTDKWRNELKYFCEHVLLSDPRFSRVDKTLWDTHVGIGRYKRKQRLETLMDFVDSNVPDYETIKTESHNCLNDMSAEDYEYYCAGILNEEGWKTQVTKASGDQGIDIVAKKGGICLAIQCKKHSNPVGNKAVQEAYSGASFYGADVGAVVAPNNYTASAIELAKSLGVHLLHHEDLKRLCSSVLK